MPENKYGSVDSAIAMTGIRPEHLGLDPGEEQKMKDLLDGWLSEVSDLIERHKNRSFGDQPPPGINSIATRALANLINYARHTREAQVVRVDDWTVNALEAQVLTRDLKRELRAYKGLPRFSGVVAGGWFEDDG